MRGVFRTIRNDIETDSDLKVFVVGSLSQEKEIKEYAKKLATKIGVENVRYAKKEPDKDFDYLVLQAYKNIDWADVVYIMKKPDGTIGTGTTYEMQYAMHTGTHINYIKS